jgi:uncharacterized repeat protein (TIGR01451 family)
MNKLIPALFLTVCFALHVHGQLDPDLDVTVQAPSDIKRAGESFSYTAIVRNIGAGTAKNVRLLNDPPENVQITSVSTSAGSCSDSSLGRGDAVSCTLGNLEPNGMVSLSFVTNVAYLEVDEAAQPSYPMYSDWSWDIGTISVDVVPDRNRTNNIARVTIDFEPRSNGRPHVRILFPSVNDEVPRSAINVKILAYDIDGSIARVIVREHKYSPFPIVENGMYKFLYMGKKYTAAQLTAYLRTNPPPVHLAKQVGKDMFEYTITEPDLGPNQLSVEAVDNNGRTNFSMIIFVVR